jgi:hypothetical protein
MRVRKSHCLFDESIQVRRRQLVTWIKRVDIADAKIIRQNHNNIRRPLLRRSASNRLQSDYRRQQRFETESHVSTYSRIPKVNKDTGYPLQLLVDQHSVNLMMAIILSPRFGARFSADPGVAADTISIGPIIMTTSAGYAAVRGTTAGYGRNC